MAEWWLGPTTADQCGHIPVILYRIVRNFGEVYNLANNLSEIGQINVQLDTLTGPDSL